MSKKTLLFSALMIFMFFAGCKAPACTDLSWGDTSQVKESGLEMKFSAGTNCENYSDYYDGDLDSVIENIKKMKFVKSDECREYFDSDISDPEDSDIVECPDFLPETINLDKMTGCKFETPPDSNTDCAYGGLLLNFDTDNEKYPESKWLFRNVEILDLYKKSGSDEPLEVSFSTDDLSVFGHFLNDSDFWMVAFWTENGEEKKVSAFYTVEMTD